MNIKKLTTKDFSEAFNTNINDYVSERINEYSFEYREISNEEKDDLILKIIKTLNQDDIVKAGAERVDEWNEGWGENLDEILKSGSDVKKLTPKYFDKYNVIRWDNKFIQPVSEKFEKNSLSIILDWVFDEYARTADAIYEFGCGTGHNLLRARQVNRKAVLWGLDWAESSQKIIEKLRSDGVDKHIFGHNFDYFKPDQSFNLQENSILYTVASLEQIGSNWQGFLEYALDKKPRLCIHIEPIGELLSDNILMQYLSKQYIKKRNYLDGYLDGLRKLELDGKIKIHKQQRTRIGSLFIEGYSLIIWSPL
jgi:hypothetical protein